MGEKSRCGGEKRRIMGWKSGREKIRLPMSTHTYLTNKCREARRTCSRIGSKGWESIADERIRVVGSPNRLLKDRSM